MRSLDLERRVRRAAPAGLAGASLIVMSFATLPVVFREQERLRAVGIMAAATFVSLPLGRIFACGCCR